jgi:hypothetical protein
MDWLTLATLGFAVATTVCAALLWYKLTRQ